jgi:DNA-directed RNA polymerase subunit RPC12/RpoP
MKYYCQNCGSEFEQGGYIPAKDSLVVMNWDCPNCDGGKLNTPIPAYETVAQWEQRKGRKYPDTAPVYVIAELYDSQPGYEGSVTYLSEYGKAKKRQRGWDDIIVATEAGAPPDDWR